MRNESIRGESKGNPRMLMIIMIIMIINPPVNSKKKSKLMNNSSRSSSSPRQQQPPSQPQPLTQQQFTLSPFDMFLTAPLFAPVDNLNNMNSVIPPPAAFISSAGDLGTLAPPRELTAE